MVVVIAAILVVVSTSWALEPYLIRQLESRTEAEWEVLWNKERLALCRARLRHNLEAICGKDVYRRSLTPPNHHHIKRSTDTCLKVHDGDGERDVRDKRAVSVNLPTATIEITPSSPDTGQHNINTRSPFLSVHQANLFVTTWVRGRRGSHYRRRRQSSSITAECCTTVGCTWEEYAEYCPTSSRLRPGVTPI
ncbi:probable insulin-like peptide 7 [Homarus americanus]|nr:probable insulin-like peptide 7 [Homarus americanus]